MFVNELTRALTKQKNNFTFSGGGVMGSAGRLAANTALKDFKKL